LANRGPSVIFPAPARVIRSKAKDFRPLGVAGLFSFLFNPEQRT
jgi:hypothetical protein